MSSHYIVPEVGDNELNINSKHPTDSRARILSNLTNRPFKINGQMCASVEGFFAGILYPPDDPVRERAFSTCYGLAQKLIHNGSKNKVWWNDHIFKYGSMDHKKLCQMAILECTLQNPDRLDALKATEDLTLRHITGLPGNPNSFLTKEEFCQILTEIRDNLSDDH